MKQFLKGFVPIVVVALMLVVGFSSHPNFPATVLAQAGPSGTYVLYPPGSDPCSNPSIAKSFAVVNIGSATTTELVATVTGKTVFMCALTATVAGTAPTLLFKTGTKVSTACDTGAANQSGTYLPPTSTLVHIDAAGNTLLTGAVSSELCVTTGGTGPSVQGNLVYVQQ